MVRVSVDPSTASFRICPQTFSTWQHFAVLCGVYCPSILFFLSVVRKSLTLSVRCVLLFRGRFPTGNCLNWCSCALIEAPRCFRLLPSTAVSVLERWNPRCSRHQNCMTSSSVSEQPLSSRNLEGKAEEMERSGLAVPAAVEKQVEELSDADIMQLSWDECRRYMMMIKKERETRFPTSTIAAPAGLLTSKSWFRMETRNEEEKFGSKRGGSAIKGVLLEASNLSAQSGPVLQHNVAGTSTISGPRNALPWHSAQSQPSLGEEVHVGASSSERAVASPLIPINQEQLLAQPSGFGSPLPTYLRTLRTTEHSQRPSQASQPGQGSGAQLGVSPRPTGQNHLPGRPPTAQLTIFYSGMVNVYDGVPADKAQAIMLLAGSGSSWSSSSMNPPPSPAVAVLPSTGGMASSSNSPAHSGPTPVVASVSQGGPVTSPLVSTISVATGLKQGAGRPTLHAELPQARKASLARFLEKRKDRVRGKAPYVPPIFSVKKDVGSSTPPREKSPSPRNSNSFTRSPSPANNLPRMNIVAPNWTSSSAQRPETSPPKTQIVALQQGPHASSSEDQASTSATYRPSPEDFMDWRSQQRPQLSSQEQEAKAMAEDTGSPSQL